MKAIADASSLIVLARQNGLWLLERLFGPVGITPGVKIETVDRGKARGYPDALFIEAALATGHLMVLIPTAAEEQLAASWQHSMPALSYTDCLTLACAKMRSLTLIMEEQRGRNLAVAHEMAYVTVQVLPLHGFIVGKLSFSECSDLLARIGQAMRTDSAILKLLQSAATEIHRLRQQVQGSRS